MAEVKTKVTELNTSYNYAISSSVIFFINVIVNFFVITKYSNCHISNALFRNLSCIQATRHKV